MEADSSPEENSGFATWCAARHTSRLRRPIERDNKALQLPPRGCARIHRREVQGVLIAGLRSIDFGLQQA